MRRLSNSALCASAVLLLAAAATAVAVHDDSNNNLYKQFLTATSRIGDEALRRRTEDDPLVPLRVMALDSPREDSDAVAAVYRDRFAEGLKHVQWHLLSAAPEQIHLSFGNDADSVHVLWVTGIQANGSAVVVLNGTRIPAKTWTYDPISVIPWYGYIHGVELRGLVPGALYTYSVGSPAGMSDVITFRAPDRSKDTIHVVLGGDMGTIQLVGWEVAKQMQAYHESTTLPIDAFWHLGDIAYSTLDPPKWNFEFFWDTYLRQEQSLISQVPMTATYGNHDFSGGDSGAFINRFRNPGAAAGVGNFYFAYTHGPVRFISMCTEVGLVPSICSYANGTAQFAWLENELKSVNRSVTPWVVVAGHRPMYSSDRSTDSGNLQKDIEILLDTYKVDVELAGHMHETEISSPVLYDTPRMAGVVQNSASSFTYTNPEAPVHITAGALGAVICEKWVEPAPKWSMFRQGTLFSGSYGFVSLVANSTTLSFEFLLQSDGSRLWDLTMVKAPTKSA